MTSADHSCGSLLDAPDLAGLSITALLARPSDDVLTHALRKVTKAAENHPQKAVSAFNSAV